MSVEGLYFVIGFLLGVLLTGCICLACVLIYHEWISKEKPLSDYED
jgi:hypothetical protein